MLVGQARKVKITIVNPDNQPPKALETKSTPLDFEQTKTSECEGSIEKEIEDAFKMDHIREALTWLKMGSLLLSTEREQFWRKKLIPVAKQRALEYSKTGKLDEAIVLYDNISCIDPKDKEIEKILTKLKRLEKTQTRLDQSVQQKAADNQADLLLKQHEQKKAEESKAAKEKERREKNQQKKAARKERRLQEAKDNAETAIKHILHKVFASVTTNEKNATSDKLVPQNTPTRSLAKTLEEDPSIIIDCISSFTKAYFQTDIKKGLSLVFDEEIQRILAHAPTFNLPKHSTKNSKMVDAILQAFSEPTAIQNFSLLTQNAILTNFLRVPTSQLLNKGLPTAVCATGMHDQEKVNVWILKFLTQQFPYRIASDDPGMKDYLEILLKCKEQEIDIAMKRFYLDKHHPKTLTPDMLTIAYTSWVIEFFLLQLDGAGVSHLPAEFTSKILKKTDKAQLNAWIKRNLSTMEESKRNWMIQALKTNTLDAQAVTITTQWFFSSQTRSKLTAHATAHPQPAEISVLMPAQAPAVVHTPAMFASFNHLQAPNPESLSSTNELGFS